MSRQRNGRALARVATAVAAVLALGIAAAQVPVVPGDAETVLAALAESPGKWADPAIEVVVSRGIYIGYPDGTFGWRQDISRAEMAVVIARLITAFGLDAFDPGEQQTLREAIVRLDDELDGALEELTALRRAVREHGGRIEDLAAEDAAQWAALDALGQEAGGLGGRVGALEGALATLRGAASQAELDAALAELDGLGEELAALSRRVLALEGALPGDGESPNAEDLSALQAELAALRGEVALLREHGGALDGRVADLETALAGLRDSDPGGDLDGATLTVELNGLGSRLGAAEADLADLEERLAALEEEQAQLVGRLDRVESELLPDRAGFYVSAAIMGVDPSSGVLAKVAVGHDSLLGNIGLRVSYEHAFGSFASNASALATYTTSFGSSDAYLGVGGGVSFESTLVPFGEMTLGVAYRIGRHVGVFVEGRYRPYFDGANEQFGGVGGGVQIRF